MRITKVYTRTGDKGKTRLAGGQLVWKDHLRVEVYGTVDELNSAIGVVRAVDHPRPAHEGAVNLEQVLIWVQHKLFDLGGILATPPGQTFPNMPDIADADVRYLERLMDACQKELPPLREFILPSGGLVSSLLHQARSICRRAERLLVKLSREEPIDQRLVKFLNRLSDALFVLARYAAKAHGKPELYWRRDIPQP